MSRTHIRSGPVFTGFNLRLYLWENLFLFSAHVLRSLQSVSKNACIASQNTFLLLVIYRSTEINILETCKKK